VRLYFHSAFLVRQFGAPLLIASSVRVGVGLCPVRHGRVELAWAMKAGLAALVVSSLVFHLFNPHLGIAPRYMYEVDAGHRLVIYRLKYRTPGSPKRLEVPLTYSLGRVIGR
jgi:hypothetical protein